MDEVASFGAAIGALGRQLSALDRRRRLRRQQEDLQAGLVDYLAIPPYPASTASAVVVRATFLYSYRGGLLDRSWGAVSVTLA